MIAACLFFKNYRGEGLLLLGQWWKHCSCCRSKKLGPFARPLNGLVADSGFSFPSGHTTGSIVFLGLIAYFVWQHWKTTKPRALSFTLFVIISSVVGFDRVYLNVQRFSDILGGAILGLCWLTFSILLF